MFARGADQAWRTPQPSAGRPRKWFSAIILVGVIALLAGCASKHPAPVGGWDWTGPVPDGYYLIRPGDTLSALAARRGVSLHTLARWNDLDSPDQIYAGRLLRVQPPDGSPPPVPARTTSAARAGAVAATRSSSPAPA
ncbi:hypothetical protein CKO25_04060, partial [Thiocapsa imhoffii]|nr:hypothetical protein [Thiocapsa imhoffii]